MNEDAEDAPRRLKRGSPRKRLWIAAAGVAIIAGIAAFLLLRDTGPELPPATKNATFPIYYPTQPPGSFAVDTNKINYDPATGILFMTLKNVYDQDVSITQQAMPSQLNFDSMKGNGDLIDGIEGKAVVGGVEGRVVATMVGKENKTLILINTRTASKEDVKKIVASLHRVRH